MAMKSVVEECLGIPQKYIKESAQDDRVIAVVHHNWLKSLIKNQQLPAFSMHESLTDEEVQSWLQQGEDFGTVWHTISVWGIKKQKKKVIPLPRSHPMVSESEPQLSFCQLLHYVSQSNHKNLWKEAYKKYMSSSIFADGRESSNINLVDCDALMGEILMRTFGLPVISRGSDGDELHLRTKKHEAHTNVLPAYCIVDTKCYFLIIQPYIKHTVHDCVTFSPAILGNSYTKPLFIIYQLLQLMRGTHDRGLALGDLTLRDIHITENMWVQVLPRVLDNVHVPVTNSSPPIKETKLDNVRSVHQDVLIENPEAQNIVRSSLKGISQCIGNNKLDKATSVHDVALHQLLELWVRGKVSNFDYIMALNYLAGRQFGNPNHHHVMPWIMDFSVPFGGWRDLSKSKFRLNKGDRQLDLTYDVTQVPNFENSGIPIQVPHHISDVLSEITYYVYMARRTPKTILCKYVRTKWVPAEYPSSIQRMQEWTPDECIPEFFMDPLTFKSIHEDLPDLEVPPWASSPERFIEVHRQALESVHVSERLHHWIDLTFGYKLSGNAAIKCKNVCLHLVDNHTNLTNNGVVQLFSQPHPHRIIPSPYYGKTPPKIHLGLPKDKKKSDKPDKSEDEDHSSGFEEEESRSLALTKFLSKSRTSLVEEKERPEPKSITIPKDYNPVTALVEVESLYGFVGKTFHELPKLSSVSAGENVNYKQAVASRRIREMQVLGCLVMELFFAARLRPVSSQNFEDRLKCCRFVLKNESLDFPRCVKQAASLLLQVHSDDSVVEDKDKSSANSSGVLSGQESSSSSDRVAKPLLPFKYPTITSLGLPPPSAHQLVQPLTSIFPFPSYFSHLYKLLQTVHDYNGLKEDLLFCDISEDERVKFLEKISDCKVKAFARELTILLPKVNSEGMDLILPYIRELMEDPYTSVSAAWYLFDPVAQALGPERTIQVLLDPVVKLFDCEEPSAKHMKLYHHSFLLQLIVRLGLQVFLNNFVTSLVEAVGGYRDVSYSERGNRYYQRSEFRSKGSHLKSSQIEYPQESEGILSPLDEDSSADSEKHASQKSNEEEKKNEEENTDVEIEPEVFVFEANEENVEDDGIKPSPSGVSLDIMDHLELNFHGETDNLSSDRISLNEHDVAQDGDDVNKDEEENELNNEDADAENVDQSSIQKPTGIAGNKSELTQSVDEDVFEEYPSDIKELSNVKVSNKSPHQSFTRGKGSLHKDEKPKKSLSESKLSDLSADTIVWLSHRLGPVLSAKYLSRNLLRMLTLCFLGEENLMPIKVKTTATNICVSGKEVLGDENAKKVLECLSSIAALYGEQLILLQYLPHMCELIASCKRKLTANLEGGLVGCIALLKHIIPYLSDATLMDQLPDNILKMVLHPVVRLMSTTRFVFPSGPAARLALVAKFLDVLYIIALRIGVEMTRKLLMPTLQRFFLAFDKAYGRRSDDVQKGFEVKKESPLRSFEESCFLEIRRDGTTTEWAIRGSPLQISHMRVRDNDSVGSFSPPVLSVEGDHIQETRQKALEELKKVFTAELAHIAYLPFFRMVGEASMEETLKNEQLIRDLCLEYEEEAHLSLNNGGTEHLFYLSDCLAPNASDSEKSEGGGFGSNVAVVGNRIDLQSADVPSTKSPCLSPSSHPIGHAESDVMSLISKKMENTNRHLRGNWLAYWEHEIGRAEKDTRFNFKQIKLQKFSGHNNGIRALHVLDNENSFLSGSRDKTVKLWSLRSQGDGSAVSYCQWTYTNHKKSVLAITFLESLRLAASCDSVVHIWDPFMGSLVKQLDSPRNIPVNVLRAMPPPSTSLLAATTDATLRVVDARMCAYVNELKVTLNPAGLIRCIAMNARGTWVAVGHSSGYLSVLDVRTGMVLGSWKGHEGEVLQLVTVNNNTIVSSSLDQAVSVWNVDDGKPMFNMKGPTEPVHCLNTYGSELISGTTANRIGVHTAVDDQASFSSTRLRSDTFRGVLTTMAVLPLNRLLLLGADSGYISLLC